MRAIPISLLSVFVLSVLSLPATAATWHPVKPEDLALKQGRIEADADAEAIEWEIEVTDEWSGDGIKSSETQYRRVKIFNTRGRDAFSRIDIPYLKGTDLVDVAARTIRPDGSVIVVKKDAMMDRTVLKGRNVKVKTRSFAMPGVEPGCIVEYRWTAVRFDQLTHHARIPLQLDIPVEQIRFSIHPLPIPSPEFKMQIRAFNFRMPPFTEEGPGHHVVTLPGMPGLKKEPFAPPELSLQPWISIYYVTQDLPPQAFWRRFGKEAYQNTRSLSRAPGDVKRAAEAALAGVTDPDLVAERLVEYCRTRIRNSDISDSGLTSAERKWLESEHPAAEYLKRGIADSDGVLKVYLSMANAAGLDARLAFLPDRSQCAFNPTETTYYLLTRSCAAVIIQGEWRAIDPTAADLAPGMLPWQIQGVDMLVPDSEEPVFVRTPIGTPEQSVRRRSARLTLSEDGTLAGDVSDELSGHEAAEWRSEVRGHSVVDREKRITDQVKSRMSTAEISEIQIDPGASASEPFRVRYRVRVPGYAQRTAQRIFLQPAFFQRGVPSLFTSAERRFPVLFDYPWAETDLVTIDLPPNAHVESTPEVDPIELSGVGKHSIRILASEDGRQLQFRHTLIFGERGTISFPVEEYQKLKRVFDQFHAQDETVVSIVFDEATPR